MSAAAVSTAAVQVLLMNDVTPLATVTHAYSYDYESSNAAPAAGAANQHTTLSTIAINETDKGGTDRSAFLNTLNNSCWLIINGVTFNILSASAASGILTLTVSPAITAPPYGITNITFVSPDQSTTVGQPLKAPVIPPPTIGNPVGVPTFPPPTPPPIGTVPAGALVGPAVANAAVPPSTAGFPLLRYATGSATAPAASTFFPAFSTAPYTGFPNVPPTGVPLVFANIWTIPTLAGGVWTAHPPASTATTPCVSVGTWGLPGPSGSGPGPPSYPNPPGAGLPHVASEIFIGDTAAPERHGDSILSAAHIAQLHQQEPPAHSRRKRMSARHAAGGSDLS